MKIFKDSTLMTEVDILDLGMLEVGRTKRFEFFVQNDQGFDVQDLKFAVDNAEVKISSSPKMLKIDAVGKLIIEWTPSSTVRKGLKTALKVNGVEIWR